MSFKNLAYHKVSFVPLSQYSYLLFYKTDHVTTLLTSCDTDDREHTVDLHVLVHIAVHILSIINNNDNI